MHMYNMFNYTYIYVFIMYIYKCICIHIYIYAYMRVHAHIQLSMSVRVRVCMYERVCAYMLSCVFHNTKYCSNNFSIITTLQMIDMLVKRQPFYKIYLKTEEQGIS